MACVVLENVTKTFMKGEVFALKDVTLKVPNSKFVTVVGPSGCGKTTLLRVIAGLEKPDSGKITIDGKVVNHIPPRERNVAMVFQSYALYPHMSVYDNIALGLKFHGYRKADIEKRVRQTSSMLSIENLLFRYPSELSGGQRQRVALARALVREPSIFLLDEPLSNLDAHIRERTRTEIKRIFESISATVLYVTHDQIEAMTMSDMVVVMNDGKICQVGEPKDVYKNPKERFVAEFFGIHRTNFIEGKIENKTFTSEDGFIKIPISLATPYEGYEGLVSFGIRPEFIKIGRVDEINFSTKVVHAELFGTQKVLFVKVGKNELKLIVPFDFQASLGDTLDVSFQKEDILIFDRKTKKRIYLLEQCKN